MADTPNGLISAFQALIGSAGTTIAAALIGRLVYHSGEVSAKRRALFGRELMLDLPVVVGMAIIGEALSNYMGWSTSVMAGVVAALAYLGPRGSSALIERTFSKGGEK